MIFLRTGAIGDIIHCIVSLELYKRQHPDASIELAVANKQVKELLLAACPFINKVWLVTHQGPFNKLFSSKISAEEQELIDSCKTSPIDKFIYLHSNILKPFLINLFYLQAKSYSVYKADRSVSAVVNYVLTYAPELKAQLSAKPFELLNYKTLYLESQIDNYICVVPGVGNLRPHRAWPLPKWFDFIERIYTTTDQNIKILGGPDEAEIATKIDKFIEMRGFNKNRVQNLIGKTSLLELAHVLNGAQHLYSADTGILHIAAALAKPITSIFTITSPQRFGPFSQEAKVLQSTNCFCKSSKTNQPKHCRHLKDNYSVCSWDIEIL